MRRLFTNQSGIAAIEFALVLPFLLTLFFGMVETTRYLLISQKLEKLAHSSSDMVAQSDMVTNTQLANLLTATTDIMKPYPFSAQGIVYVSSVYRGQGQLRPVISWQRSGGGTLARDSRIGQQAGEPNLPPGFTVAERENVIVAEVFYRYEPLLLGDFLGSFIGERLIYHRAFYRPRLGALNTAPN